MVERSEVGALKAIFGPAFDRLLTVATRNVDANALARMRPGTLKRPEKYIRRLRRIGPKSCDFLRFSDTILLYRRDENQTALLNVLLSSVRVVGIMLNLGIPVRGAVTRGPLEVERSGKYYFGEGLIRAYRREQSQDWVGAELDIERMNSRHFSSKFLRSMTDAGLLMDWEIPRKEGAVDRGLAIGWPLALAPVDGFEGKLREAVRNSVDWGARRKHESTLRFYQAYVTQHLMRLSTKSQLS